MGILLSLLAMDGRDRRLEEECCDELPAVGRGTVTRSRGDLGATPIGWLARTTFAVDASTTIAELVERAIFESSDAMVPVVRRRKVVGFIGLIDALDTPTVDRAHMSVSDLMTPWPHSSPISAHTSVLSVLGEFERSRVGRLAVCEGRTIVATVRRRDVESWMRLREIPDVPRG